MIYSDMSLAELEHHFRMLVEEINLRGRGDVEVLAAMIYRHANRNDSEGGTECTRP